jgi:hypothetical protein
VIDVFIFTRQLGSCLHRRTTEVVVMSIEIALKLSRAGQPGAFVRASSPVRTVQCCDQGSIPLWPLAGPALFLNALWLPYRRNRGELEAALAAAGAEATAAGGQPGGGGGAPLQAVFAHTDIVSVAGRPHY